MPDGLWSDLGEARSGIESVCDRSGDDPGNMVHPLDQLNQRDEAFRLLDRALTIRKRQVETEPRVADHRHSLAGLIDSRAGCWSTRCASRRRRRRFARRLPIEAGDGTRPKRRREIRRSWATITSISRCVNEQHLGRFKEGLAARREAVAIWVNWRRRTRRHGLPGGGGNGHLDIGEHAPVSPPRPRAIRCRTCNARSLPWNTREDILPQEEAGIAATSARRATRSVCSSQTRDGSMPPSSCWNRR